MGSRWWGGWAGLLAAGVVALPLAAPEAAELTGIRATRTERGAIVRFELTAPTPTRVRAVATSGDAATRLYLDLAPGTSLGPRLAHEVVGPPPLGVLRLGIGDEGVLRVVLDLEAGVRYRLGSERRGRTIALALVTVAPGAPDAAGDGARAATAHRLPPPRIVIDPGHGGRDPGAQGYGVEKDVTLSVAQRLAALLDERLDVDVALTRSSDTTLTLAERTALANAGDADLFVSIHANASPNPRLRGIETYYLKNTDDHATIRLASIENGPDAAPPADGRADLRYILSDLVQVGKMEESVTLARALQRNLVARLRGRYRGVVDLGVKRGPFYVLVGAHMPCVLVEVSFLTHPTEGSRLAGDAYQETIAEGLYAGIARFLANSRRAHTL